MRLVNVTVNGICFLVYYFSAETGPVYCWNMPWHWSPGIQQCIYDQFKDCFREFVLIIYDGMAPFQTRCLLTGGKTSDFSRQTPYFCGIEFNVNELKQCCCCCCCFCFLFFCFMGGGGTHIEFNATEMRLKQALV